MKDLDFNKILEKLAMDRLDQKDTVEDGEGRKEIYSSAELKRASLYIAILALSHDESEEETRAKLTNAIHEAMNNQNPEKRRIWDTFEFAGEEPTPEEFLLWFYRIYHLATELGNE